MEIAIKRTQHLNQHIDPLAPIRIIEDQYVSDLSTGETLSEVNRFIGKPTVDMQHDGTIPQILSKGSLRLKLTVSTEESDWCKVKKLGNKILGVSGIPRQIKDNFSTFIIDLLPRRNLLRIVNSLYSTTPLVLYHQSRYASLE